MNFESPPTLRPAFAIALVALFLGATLASGQQFERINVDGLGRLPAFSHATTVGDLIFVSGTLGTKPGSTTVVPGGISAETKQTMENIGQILEATGSDFEHLAKCTVYLVDLEEFAAMNRVWLSYVGDTPPARAAVEVSELALGARVEIECIAVKAASGD